MKILYFISIIGIILLGIAHSSITFKRFDDFSPESFWFFSAGLALIFTGIANIMHYHLHNMFTYRCVLVINLLLLGFTALLSYKVPAVTTFLVVIFTFLLCISTFFNKRN